MYEYDVDGERPVLLYAVPEVTVAICVPLLYIRYPVTPTLSVDTFHERLIWEDEMAVECIYG